MTIAIIGAPNSGKSVLFNFLTGLNQKVANYPGCTVVQKYGKIRFAKEHNCVDLPGTYSLHYQSQDAGIATDYVLDYKNKNIDHFLIVCNSVALQRSLVLVLQLKKLGVPASVVLNMEDELLLSGGKIDTEYLTQELGIPVFLLSATRRWNIMPMVNHIRSIVDGTYQSPKSDNQEANQEAMTKSHIPEISEIEGEIVRICDKAYTKLSQSHKTSDKLDTVLLHPVWGRLLLLGIALVIFQSIFTWVTPMMDGISFVFDWLSATILKFLPKSWFSELLGNGILVGIGSVLVFLPQIIVLTLAMAIMEMSGYMARATFLMDSLFQKIGLQGKVFIPLLTGHACAIPGIMACRTIGNQVDRLITIFTVPFMSCSARLPVYTMLITAFIPDQQVLGFISIRTLVLFGLYLGGSVVGIGLAGIMKLLYMTIGRKNTILLLDRVAEIPIYRIPSLSSLLLYSWRRVKLFLKRASTIILSISVIFWVLTNTYVPGGIHDIEHSLAALLGKFVHVIFAPWGLDWQSSTAVIIGLTAREVFVGAVSVLYHADGGSLSSIISSHLSFASGIALLVYYIYAPQCLATFAVMFKETRNRWFTAFSFVTMFSIAYLFAFVVYKILV